MSQNSSQNPLSKRRQFGDAIAFMRGEQSMSQHHLADKTRTTTKIVGAWEAGEAVPTTQEWQRLRAIFTAFSSAASRYAELYRAAAAEQLALEQVKEIKRDEQGDLSAAVRLLIEAVPNLRALTVDIDDDGEVSVAFKTREVRVVEDSGSMKVRLR